MLYHWQIYLRSTKVLNSLIVFVTLVISGSCGNSVLAQITPDDSLGTESSVVTPNVEIKGKTADRIDGGATREGNLFHSFQEFNVREGQSVYFASPESIENIFTRVTGNNPSNILGTLGVDGVANLLLLNPNGILFGENSSLDIEGSFLGTTAESLIFRDGAEFSAVEPRTPLLTISVPLGLQFGSNPGNIMVQSSLEVPNGQNFSLVGGDIDLKGSNIDTNLNGINTPADGITAPRGRIELGGLSTAGIVNFEDSNNLNFPDGIPRADITLDNFFIDTIGGGGGLVAVYSQNLRLIDSIIATGIDFSVELTQDRAGDITINTTEEISLEASYESVSRILNITGDFSDDNVEVVNTAGNAGNIVINTGSLSATGVFDIASITNGQGNAGSVNINANKSIVLESFVESNVNSGIASRVLSQGTGNGANIKINTPSLSLNNAVISTTTFGAGNAGDILINATDSVVVSNGSIVAATFSSGDAGNIVFESETADLTFKEQTFVGTPVFPTTEKEVVNFPDLSFVVTGRGGDIKIKARNFSAIDDVIVSTFNGGEVNADGLANAGNLELNISDSITVQDNSVLETTSVGRGNAGNLTINTDRLSVQNSYISTTALGLGQAGNIDLNASESIDLSGTWTNVNEDIIPAGLFSSTIGGNAAGNVNVNTGDLTITDGAQIQASTTGAGDGGNITIKADRIQLTGNSGENFPSVLVANTLGSGTGGTVEITTNNLVISDGAAITVSSSGNGNAGEIFAEVFNSFEADNGNISSRSFLSSGGDINITAGNIRLKGNSNIVTNVEEGAGGGGNITLTADSVVAFDDSDIFAFSSDGVGGDITINSPVLFLNGFSAANLNANPESLEGNNRVDINASGAVSGSIEIPAVNFLSDSLVELSEKAINTEELVANSCVVRDRPSSGTFIITGKGGLPIRPGNWSVSTYSTGDVRTIPHKIETTSTNNNWQPSAPIVEPQGIYRLSNGKLVLSRECG